MKTSESIKTLAGAFVKVQSKIKEAKKSRLNPFYKSNYSDLSDIWEACRDALHENGFTILQPTNWHDGSMFVETMLLHTSGEWISGEYLITSDKPGPQAIGAAVSYSKRYALASMVGVTTEDDDAEGATDHSGGQKSVAQPTHAAQSVFRPKTVTPGAISEAQGKRFWAIASTNGKSKEDIADYLAGQFNAKRTEEIPRARYEEAVLWAQTPTEEPKVLADVPF